MKRSVDESLQSYIHKQVSSDRHAKNVIHVPWMYSMPRMSIWGNSCAHIQEFPFLCHLLDACMRKCFTQAGALKSHKRTHSGEKPFECDRCDKCFSEASNLRAHKGTHSGENLFECDLCGKCFSRDWDLKRHKKKTQHTDIYEVGAARRFLQHLWTIVWR